MVKPGFGELHPHRRLSQGGNVELVPGVGCELIKEHRLGAGVAFAELMELVDRRPVVREALGELLLAKPLQMILPSEFGVHRVKAISQTVGIGVLVLPPRSGAIGSALCKLILSRLAGPGLPKLVGPTRARSEAAQKCVAAGFGRFWVSDRLWTAGALTAGSSI